MKRKIKHLGILALIMGIITSSSLVLGNKIEVLASSVADTLKVQNLAMFGRDIHKFDNLTDMMYYSVFGESFEIMQQHSKEVNKEAYYDGIRMEVLSTVTIAQEDFYTSYTFFTLQDTSSNNRITNTTRINLQNKILQDNIVNAWGNAVPVLFDEETHTMTFIGTYTHYNTEGGNYLEHMPINIETIIDNYTTESKPIHDINIMDLINNHDASFTNNRTRGGGFGNQLEELGLDFHELLEEDTLKKDELSIPIQGWDSAYISNIALIDNMLHIQTNTLERRDITEQWFNLTLIDTKTDNVATPIYSINLDNMDEDFNIIEDKVYQDFVYLIEDINNLQHYSLNLETSYYDTIINTDLEISFSSPIFMETYKVGEATQILIDNQETNISNIKVSTMGVNFTIDEIELLPEDIREYSEVIKNNIDVTLIYNNGVEDTYLNNSIGTSWWQEDQEEFIRDITIKLEGSVIDVDNLVAIKINGTIIEVN